MGNLQPKIEAFADRETHLFPTWFGEGGIHHDAMTQSWDFEKCGLLWANPPFSKLNDVVKKIVTDKAQVLFVCPVWKKEKFLEGPAPLGRK